MELKDWLKENEIRPEEFAKEGGFKRSTVYSWIAIGKISLKIPRPENLEKIMKLTGGKVTPNDFY